MVVGSYLASTGEGSDALRIDLRIQDNRSGEIVAAVVETGTVGDLADLVLLAGARLRGSLAAEDSVFHMRIRFALDNTEVARASPGFTAYVDL